MKGLNPKQREAILCKWCKKKMSYRKIAKEEGVSVWAVQKTIKRFTEHYTLDDLPGRGRKKAKILSKIDQRIISVFTKEKEISVRDCAKKCGTSSSTVQRVKVRNNFRTYRKQKCPKRSKVQSAKAKQRARKLYRHILNKKFECIVMDDETYVKLDYKTLPGPQFFTVNKEEKVTTADKSIQCEKFGKKLMVWQAICQCGKVSSPFVTNKTMNQEIYLKECLKKRLLPLIKEHSNKPLFWPDLASCHYASSVVNWYDSENLDYVKKELNPPNCPELRPIERFWAIIKRDLKQTCKPADSVKKFKYNWNRVVKKRGERLAKNLMKDVKKKVRKMGSGEQI